MKKLLLALLLASPMWAQPTCSGGVLTGLDTLLNKMVGPLPCAGSYGSSINPWAFEDSTYDNAVSNLLTKGGNGQPYGPWWEDTGIGDAGRITASSGHIVSGGSGYAQYDYFTVNGGSVLAKCQVASVSGGAVTSYYCQQQGTGYTSGTKATTATTGAGSGLTISVLTNEGTVSITAGSSTIVGVGTHFLELCAAGSVSDIAPVISVNMTGSDGSQYVQFRVTACIDNTHLSVAVAYPSTAVGTMEDCSGGCNTRSYSWCNSSWPCSASYFFGAPMAYYDSPFGMWKRWKASADTTFRDGFRTWAKYMWDAPWVNHGNQILFDSGGSYPFRTDTFSSLVLRALDGHSEMWPGLRQMCTQAKDAFTGPTWTSGFIYDLREEMYAALRLVWCAAEDPDSSQRSTWRSALVTAATNVWTPYKTSNGAAWYGMGANEGSGIGSVSGNMGTSSNPMFTGGQLFGTIHLVNGSTTITLNSGTWFSYNFSGIGDGSTSTNASCGPRAQHQNGKCLVVISNPANATAWPSSNAAFVNDYWSVSYVDSTHATIDHSWTGATGDYGWIYDGPMASWIVQPYFLALFGTVAEMAGDMFEAAGDSTNAAIWRGYNTHVVAQLPNAILASGGGAYALGGVGDCASPPAPHASMCAFESGIYSADVELTNELLRPLGKYYARTGESTVKDLADSIMDGIFCKTGDCGRTPPANYNTNWDYPGGYNYVSPFLCGFGSICSATMHKQFGQFFGFGGGDTWPALRVATPASSRSIGKLKLSGKQKGNLR